MNFTAVSARYVRLTATTEAGNRGPWSSAAEINLLGPSLGSWGPTINFPLVPAAAALLPGNRMLTWSAYSPTSFWRQQGLHPGVHPEPVHRRREPGPGGQHRSRHVLPRDLDAAGREDPDQRRQQQLKNHRSTTLRRTPGPQGRT